jgi:two-component system sensor histidine kinase HydH
MAEPERRKLAWVDLLWLVFLGGLAVLPPLFNVHKQLTLLAIGVYQLFEHAIMERAGPRGRHYTILIKIGLASLLLTYTEGISSSYYLIYYLPVVSAAMYFGTWGTLAWTALSSAAYCSFLIPALQYYQLTPEGATELAIRNLFFFLAAVVVNRFVIDSRRQAESYRLLAETLAETNRQLEQIQEEARRSERLAALGQLSAGLAHEIRNPLGVIKGSAEMLNKKLSEDDAVTGELAGYISSEVNRLNILVTRFLDFARPLDLHRQPQEIPPLVDRALKSVHDRWPQARVEVERQYSPDLPVVPVDADFCEQVFTNLVLNSYEAMEPEGGKLVVSIHPATSDGRRGVQLDFEDSGPGIPAEAREQIFNPFFTTKKGGVGLGLSVVSKIVDDHHGWIRAVSGPDKGACFQVFLPVE